MIDSNSIRIECPKCKKVALPISRPKSICECCGKKYKWHELQRKWQKSYISSQNGAGHDTDEIFKSCVLCKVDSMIYYDKLKIWVCFSCGTGWKENEIVKCRGCNNFTDNTVESICSSCELDILDGIMTIPPDFPETKQLQL